MVISELILQSSEVLKSEGIQSYILDTHLLLCMFLGVDRTYLLTNREKEVKQEQEFFKLVNRRANHEPLQYITGKCEFMSLDFHVEHGVLIPRPDTEILVESVIEYAGQKSLSMLEIGTGSGCISISCAYYCKNLTIDALDISHKALDIARGNADKHNIDNISFINKNILTEFPNGAYDIVVSNPPYIETKVIETLMPEVRDFEPLSALDGGCDGLAFYRRIVEKSKVNKLIAFEVGHNQSDAVIQILKKGGYKNIEVIKDLSSIERVVLGKKD